MTDPRDERPAVDTEAVERIAARFAAADPKWHRLLQELRRRYPKESEPA
jgi:hypothetical protein